MASSTEEFSVELYIYDLSRGLARQLSLPILGFAIDGIWHTSIVYSEREYFYGAEGVMNCPPAGTILGQPTTVKSLGVTQIPRDVFLQHLDILGTTTFRGEAYDLFNHNCNNFSQELSNFLTGNNIPQHILNLPHEVANTPLGQLIRQFSQTSLITRQRGGFDPNPLEILIRERVLSAGGIKMGDSDSDQEATPQPVIKKRDLLAEVEEEERKEREEKKKQREPPIVFRDLGHHVDELLDELEKSLDKVELNDEEMRCLKELREYSLGDEGSWVLSDDFLNLIGRILLSGESGIGDESRLHLLKILAWLAVTKDDVILVLHQDRRDHVIMRYASNIDQLSPQCQEGVALLICNLFENLSTSEWLLYISEWGDEGRGATSNIRVTTKVAVHALLSKDFKDVGSALVYNMLSKEVFDDVSVEVAMALLQFLTEKVNETLVWRALKSLLRCCTLARTEVPSLVKMVGPNPVELKGVSARCDELITQLDSILKSA